MDRREFLGTATLTVSAVAAATLIPIPAFSAPGAVDEGLYSVDDACGHWPPYSHPIPYGHPEPVEVSLAHVDPIDRYFVA